MLDGERRRQKSAQKKTKNQGKNTPSWSEPSIQHRVKLMESPEHWNSSVRDCAAVKSFILSGPRYFTLPTPHMRAPASAQPFSHFEKKTPDTFRALLGTGWPQQGGLYLFSVSANLDGIGNEPCCLLLGHGADVLQANCQLQQEGKTPQKGEAGERSSRKSPPKAQLEVGEPHQCLPAEDVAVEADPVLGEVEAALQENVSLEST